MNDEPTAGQMFAITIIPFVIITADILWSLGFYWWSGATLTSAFVLAYVSTQVE